MRKAQIFKYPVYSAVVEIHMNREAVILSAQPQRNIPTIWATYDADKELSYRRFHLFTTGELIDNELLKKLKFIATIQQNDGDYVTHLFEEIN